ncbi:Ivy family c-type lysozyme inhibitor [Variovorax soli]|uniref:Inhibitor of vertebrate lysozyme (Ivy) n=1 Tax=Variovorax soli TaxID=376815 RepID=A0ABU1NAG4_9BURK|nr:Ivy family c-type lysozyme inhibitor [Variovorax soli]MDR6535434.1 hypothetical protein [Variovorax soli]
MRSLRRLLLVGAWGVLASTGWAREPSEPAAPGHTGSDQAEPQRPAARKDPAALIADQRFRRNWRLLLGAHASEPWLGEMNGPARAPRWVNTSSGRFVLHAFCQPHGCHDNNVVLLYNPYDGRIHGLVHRAGGAMLIGNPPPEVALDLQRLWLKEWRPQPR